MGWPRYLQESHMMLTHWLWIERMHKEYPISLDDCWKAWAMFKANPADPRLRDFKRGVSRLWLLHVQSN